MFFLWLCAALGGLALSETIEQTAIVVVVAILSLAFLTTRHLPSVLKNR